MFDVSSGLVRNPVGACRVRHIDVSLALGTQKRRQTPFLGGAIMEKNALFRVLHSYVFAFLALCQSNRLRLSNP